MDNHGTQEQIIVCTITATFPDQPDREPYTAQAQVDPTIIYLVGDTARAAVYESLREVFIRFFEEHGITGDAVFVATWSDQEEQTDDASGSE